ncbi:MAG: helix-turn-helix domain-containing protein [Thermoplasmata archaeon]|nr:helix-turn-helix domain-containing protein [Thermoplasmata archaeon]
MPRATRTLLELLVEHGIPERGARLYLAACRAGPQTASELARLAALHRVEAYRFLRQLQDEGLLQTTGRRPMRLVAVPPAEILDRWIHRAADRLRRLEGDKPRLLNDLEEDLLAPDPGDARKFQILEGRAAIQAFLKRRLGTAQKEIALTVSGFALAAAIDGGVDRAIKEAVGRGVRARMVTEISSANQRDAQHFATFVELRHASAAVTNRAIAVDRSGLLVFVSGEEGLGPTGESQVALWTTSSDLLARARQYHQRVWSQAIAAARRFVELESPASAYLPVVQNQLGEPFQRLREITELGMRATGVRELRFDLPELIETVGHQLGRTIATRVEGGSPAEVGRSLAEFYEGHALGKLSVVRDRPVTLRVSDCFACLPQSPEIGRVLCPRLIKSVLETRLGSSWEVSRPDPRRHAAKGCVFTVTPSG